MHSTTDVSVITGGQNTQPLDKDLTTSRRPTSYWMNFHRMSPQRKGDRAHVRQARVSF